MKEESLKSSVEPSVGTTSVGPCEFTRRSFIGTVGAWVIIPALHPFRNGLDIPSGLGAEAEPDSGGGELLQRSMERLFLTFDDGPQDSTARILDCLAEREQKATFFLIGRHLKTQRLRELAIRAVQEGHEIGNHSYSHRSFSHISARAAETEIRDAHELIEEVVRESGVEAKSQNIFFRFPYGDEGVGKTYRVCQSVLAQLGYRIAAWTLDTNDWQMDPSLWWRQPWRVMFTLRRARANDVILMHDRTRTARILPSVIDALSGKSLESVQLSKFDQILAESAQGGSLTDDTDPGTRFDLLGIRSMLEKFLPGSKGE